MSEHLVKDIDKLETKVDSMNREMGGLQAKVTQFDIVSKNMNDLAKNVGAMQQQLTHIEDGRKEDRETHKRMFAMMESLKDSVSEKVENLTKSFNDYKANNEKEMGKLIKSSAIWTGIIVTILMTLVLAGMK